jgi:hypothetical protein
MTSLKKTTDSAVARVGDIPEHMLAMLAEQKEHDSLANMRHHRTLARVAIIQGSTKGELKEKYGEGSLVIVSAEKVLCKVNEFVDLVPVLFFDEYIAWNDRKDKISPMIHEKSFEHGSIVASKAGVREKWSEKYGDKLEFERRYAHHLNFVCAVYGNHELKGVPVTLSYSRGSFKKGRALIDAIKLRRINGMQVPLYGSVFRFMPARERNDKGEWWVAGFKNPDPPESPWIASADAPIAKTMHDELLKDYESRDLSVKHEEAEKATGDDPGVDIRTTGADVQF